MINLPRKYRNMTLRYIRGGTQEQKVKNIQDDELVMFYGKQYSEDNS
jgi:hypothetical protein